MSATDTEIVPLTAAPEKPPATRLFFALQRLSRVRDEYSRNTDPTAKLESAREIIEKMDELRGLAEELLREAEANLGNCPTDTVPTS